jgi:hypothetical protein
MKNLDKHNTPIMTDDEMESASLESEKRAIDESRQKKEDSEHRKKLRIKSRLDAIRDFELIDSNTKEVWE